MCIKGNATSHDRPTTTAVLLTKCAVVIVVAAITISGCAKTHDDGGSGSSTAVTNESGTQSAASDSTQKADSEVEGTEELKSETKKESADVDTTEPEATWKERIEGLPDDFMLGMDASSVLAEEKSGVKYYNFEGEEQDVFKTFADAGINYIRLRVWNDPYDENGNGYGGGNNDLDTAIELGKRATQYGMKVFIDFHYSDFWADPKRQHAPKAWSDLSVDDKADALYEYTKSSLVKLLDAGVDVEMVQIGNEINYGISGETKFDNVVTLLKSGSRAIRKISADYDMDIDIVVHYTRITDKADVLSLVDGLVKNDLDFDMIGMSYYPFWDGGMDNMGRVLELIKERYGKDAFIAETSYCYTTKDGDGFGNSIGAADLVDGYEASVDGQASIIHDICSRVNEVGGKGIFYWEGAWIPVGSSRKDNEPIWERYGSGWASSYAAGYDPDDAGLYYGGSSWDNQAFFDFDGHPLESLNVFKYMRGELFADQLAIYQRFANHELSITDLNDAGYYPNSYIADWEGMCMFGQLSYVFYDLDNDDSPELLIVEPFSDSDGTVVNIYDIYSYHDGQVVECSNMNDYEAHYSSELVNQQYIKFENGGTGTMFSNYCKYEDGRLKLVEVTSVDSFQDKEIFMHCIAQDGKDEDYTEITEDEYKKIQDSYISTKLLECIPFVS